MGIQNETLRDHVFVVGMLQEGGYYPRGPVEKVQAVLVRLCERIEAERPADVDALYVLTHAATEEVNDLLDEFGEAGSEIDTVARDIIGTEFELIAHAYGFVDADVEELIDPRDW